LLLVLFLSFSSTTMLLGDGTLRANQIHKGQVLLPTEILDFIVHAVLFRFVFHPLGLSVSDCYNVVSALCGVIFVIGISRLVNYLNPKQSLVTFLLMLTSGITVLFFGYIESYSLLAALLPYIVLSGLNVVDGQAGRTSFVLWYIFAGLVHVVSLFLFFGSLIVILRFRPDQEPLRGKRVSLYLAATILVVLALAYTGQVAGVGDISRYLLAPFPQEGYRQGIFTVNHWLNILNWLLLSALPFLFLLGAVRAKKRVTDHALSGRSLYALWIIIPSLLFMFFFVPQLGGPRDWDLFSLPAFLLIPSILIIYFSRQRRLLPPQIIPLIFLSACTTAPFAVINNNVVKATDRFVEIIEVAKFKNLTKEYKTLLNFAQTRPEISRQRLEYALKVWEQPPYNKSDSAFILSRIGDIYLGRGDSAHALSYLTMAIAVDTIELNSYLSLTRYYDRYGTRQDLLALAETLERLFPQKALAIMNAGIIYQRLGETERGEHNLEQAFYFDSTDYFVLLNYSILQIQKQNFQRCLEVLPGALEINPESFLANYYLSLANISLGNVSQARAYLGKAEALTKNSSQRQMVQDLKGKFQSPK